MYSIKNQNGEFFTIRNFSDMTFTNNANFRYLFDLDKANQMLSYLQGNFPDMILTICK